MSDPRTPMSVVREAAEMLLRLGAESYAPEIVADEGDKLQVSPFAGEQVKLKHLQHTTVGPHELPCDRHVAAVFDYYRHEIMVYALVNYGEDGPRKVELSIYINGQFVIHRKVYVRQGQFVPVGMPVGFDPTAP